MKTRTAMVACVGDNEGAWGWLKGNEAGLLVDGLGQGERVFLELRADTPAIPGQKLFFAEEGPHPVSFGKYAMYRVGKLAREGEKSPTTVEIILNGSTAGKVS